MKERRSSLSIVLIVLLLLISCNKNEPEIINNVPSDLVDKVALPNRSGPRPETTSGVPHVQIDVKPVPEVHEEMIRRVYAIPGIEDRPSVIASWRGIWLSEDLTVVQPEALISGREYAHIHNDGSLHIFLAPERAIEAEKTGWAIAHPYAVQGLQGWDGFVMLYTPQSFDELNVTFQLIVDGFNYVTGRGILARDYYD